MDAVTRRREQRKATAPGIAGMGTGPFQVLLRRERPLLVHAEALLPGHELLRQGSETSYQGPVCPKLCLLFEVASATTFEGGSHAPATPGAEGGPGCVLSSSSSCSAQWQPMLPACTQDGHQACLSTGTCRGRATPLCVRQLGPEISARGRGSGLAVGLVFEAQVSELPRMGSGHLPAPASPCDHTGGLLTLLAGGLSTHHP